MAVDADQGFDSAAGEAAVFAVEFEGRHQITCFAWSTARQTAG
jgi:hypothetical protein